MKKIKTITFLFAFAAAVFSCSKEKITQVANSASPPVTTIAPKGINYVTEWMSIPFSIATDRRTHWLEGRYSLPSFAGYNISAHKQFAFIRLNGRSPYNNQSLPFQIQTTDGTIEFSFTSNDREFVVKAINIDYPQKKPAFQNELADNSTFRFLIVTDSTFRAHQIDWADYSEVGRALRPTIWFE